MTPTPHKKSWFKRFGYQVVRHFLWVSFKILFRIRYEGLEKIPQSGPVLICANHQSHLDPPLIASSSPRPMNFLAKKDLFDFAPLRWLISFLNAYPIDRDGVSAPGIKATLRCLERDEMVLMFPEGTRTPDGEIKRVRPGFCPVINRTGAVLLPVGIQGAWEVWPRHRSWPLPGPKIVIVIGDPIIQEQYHGLDEKQMVEMLDQEIKKCVAIGKTLRIGKKAEAD